MNIGSMQRHVGSRAFAIDNGTPSFAGISGGRTSGLMAFLLDPDVRLVFCNTGREHPKTLEFLDRIDHALGGRITWLEWGPPVVHAAPPRDFTYRRVTYATASRKGEPFRGFMQALADYRKEHKGLGPVAPWARARMCTAYMKIRVQDLYAREFAPDGWDNFVGLRADEISRVQRLMDTDTEIKQNRVPLHAAGITKLDVNAWWAAQPFDLEIPNAAGNCTACFLKDQSDLSEQLQDPETDAAWWEALEADYPRFGGDTFVGYAALRAEWPLRSQIRNALRTGGDLPVPSNKREKNVIKQEQRRHVHGSTPFTCECEGAAAIANGAEV